jgi:outer membrane protein OmpA-like peptidoglycan-associated protein
LSNIKDEERPVPKTPRRLDTAIANPTASDTLAKSPILAADSIKMSLDSDHDGINDFEDKCVDTPAGALVDSSGCPLDEDGDGVYDGLDKCPHTPLAAKSALDESGCPLDLDHDGVPDYLDKCLGTLIGVKVDSLGCSLDGDSDGVPDGLDSCPNTPKGLPVDTNGCVDKEKVFRKRTYRDLFNSGETRLTPLGDSTLDSIAMLLKEFPEVTVIISCFTDDLGPADANLAVSQKRSAAVARYLEIKGVSSKRLKAVGKGESEFLASNKTRAGREKNRRVELEFKIPSGPR